MIFSEVGERVVADRQRPEVQRLRLGERADRPVLLQVRGRDPGVVPARAVGDHDHVRRPVVAFHVPLFGFFLRRRTLGSQFLLGALNGLLPCGLVYIAAAAAAATLQPAHGALHMAAFGAGTLPIMFGLSAAAPRLRSPATSLNTHNHVDCTRKAID